MRSIAVVTGTRADFGIWLPVLRAIEAAPGLRLRLMACAMHLSPQFGHTIDAVSAAGFAPECIETLVAGDTPEAVAKSMALTTMGFAQAFARERPDLLFLLGDRTEMLAAATAALPFNIPIAHLHGGEATEGLIDEAIRHAVTKMSHLHFASTEAYAARLRQMGEDPANVLVSGAPALDHLHSLDWLDKAELERRIDLSLDTPPLLVTYHPVTLAPEQAGRAVAEMLAALDETGLPAVITYPNSDTGNNPIMLAIQDHVATRPHRKAVKSLGTQAYFSLMRHAAAMVGNSSSGIIEAASFGLPVVNIGSRQAGRVRGANVIDCAEDCAAIVGAVARAISPDFRAAVAGMANPYGDGHAATRIVRVLNEAKMGPTLLHKRFHELGAPG